MKPLRNLRKRPKSFSLKEPGSSDEDWGVSQGIEAECTYSDGEDNLDIEDYPDYTPDDTLDISGIKTEHAGDQSYIPPVFIAGMIQSTDKACKFVDPLTKQVVYSPTEAELTQKSPLFRSRLRKKVKKEASSSSFNEGKGDLVCGKCGFDAESRSALNIHLRVAHKVSLPCVFCESLGSVKKSIIMVV